MKKDYQKWNKKSVELRFGDLDMLGHVNNAKYFTYIESARISYFHEVIGDKIDWSTRGIILAKAELNFAVPVVLEDLEVFIFTSCTEIGEKSFELSYVITKSDLTTICAHGSTAMVCYNYKEARTIQVPEEWRSKFEEN